MIKIEVSAKSRASLENAKFCTEYSIAANEPLAGEGGHSQQNILIQWPKKQWCESICYAAGMDDLLQARIEACRQADWRINLIDRKTQRSDLTRVYILPMAMSFDLTPDRLPLLLDHLILNKPLDGFDPRPMRRSVILCCTHGKHDRCCAKFGFATYKVLANAAETHADKFSVWEATHLGGCRLAASVMVMPSMRKYGRIWPKDTTNFLEAEARGLPYLPCYRGASHLSPVEQVAEVAALSFVSKDGIVGNVTLTLLHDGSTKKLYRAEICSRALKIRCTSYEIRTHGDCESLDAKDPLEPEVIWKGVVEEMADELRSASQAV